MKSLQMAAALAWSIVLTAPAFGDSIDEAEAKRRGVPVSQVQAENALAAEQHKTAELTQQIAKLQKQLAELRGRQSPGGPSAIVATGSAQASRISSPLYNEFVARYLSGDLESLSDDLAARQKEIDALPPANRDDLAYIAQSAAECRPAWWDTVESTPHAVFDAQIFKTKAHVDYSPGNLASKGVLIKGQYTLAVSWPGPDMDDPTLVTLQDLHLDVPGKYAFPRGDVIDLQVWNAIGTGSPVFEFGSDAWKKALDSPIAIKRARDYLSFWGDVAPAYYLNPRARRLFCATAFCAFGHQYDDRPTMNSRRTMASMLLIEFISHRSQYPSLQLDQVLAPGKLPPDTDGNGEAAIAAMVTKSLLDNKLTLAEDRHLRDAIKAFAMANDPWDQTKDSVELPNKMAYELDQAAAKPHSSERYAWLKEQLSSKQ